MNDLPVNLVTIDRERECAEMRADMLKMQEICAKQAVATLEIAKSTLLHIEGLNNPRMYARMLTSVEALSRSMKSIADN